MREITSDDFCILPDFLRIEYLNGRWCRGDWSELLIDDEVFKYPENPQQYNIYRLSLVEPVNKYQFEIRGNNYEKVKEFERQHKKCCCDEAGGISYEFYPGIKEMVSKIKCICGKELVIKNQNENCE